MSLPEAVEAMGSRDEGLGSGSAVTRRSLVALVLSLAASGPLLSACGDTGFRPLYGSSGIGANVDAKLAQVDMTQIPGRVGQRIRNEFIFQSTGGASPVPPSHRLEVAIRENVTSTLVRSDGDAQGSVYNLDASFQLIRLSDKAVVLKGTSYSRAGFERFQSIFSNVRARQDAENRAAKTLGEDLRARISAFLAGDAA
jgi:LPS-assembly lipoprotein